MKLLKRSTPPAAALPPLLAESQAAATTFVQQADNRELDRLMAAGPIVEVAPGDTVVAEGNLGHNCVFVLDGRLDVVRNGEVVADVAPGWFGGEMALRHHQRRNATLVAATPGRVLIIGRGAFEQLLATCPSIRAHVDATIETRLATT
jgi:CRP-like cAMP-binding protein